LLAGASILVDNVIQVRPIKDCRALAARGIWEDRQQGESRQRGEENALSPLKRQTWNGKKEVKGVGKELSTNFSSG